MQRNRTALTLTLAVAGALAVPAVAAVPAEPGSAHERPDRAKGAVADVAVFPQPHRAAARVAAAGREARRERRERRGPVHPLAVESDYGTADNAFGAARSGHMHAGQDVFAPAGSPLVAVSEAEVVEAGSDGSQGNYAYLYDARADRTYVYMHMVAPPAVETGDRVDAGQRLGGVGCTGSCWGDHLHFEVHAGRGIEGEAQDPLPLLQQWRQAEPAN